MEISVSVDRHVVVDDDVHVVYVYASAENISCYQYSLLELLECSVASQSNKGVSQRKVCTVLLGPNLCGLRSRGSCSH